MSPAIKTKSNLTLLDLEPVVTAEKKNNEQKDPVDAAPKRVNQDDWRKLALIVDRLAFYLFMIVGVIGTSIIFSKFGMWHSMSIHAFISLETFDASFIWIFLKYL